MYLLKYFLFIFLVLFSLRPALAMEPTPKQSNWLHATLTQNLVSRNQKLLHNQAKITPIARADTFALFVIYKLQFDNYTANPSLANFRLASSTLDSINKLQITSLKNYLKKTK